MITIIRGRMADVINGCIIEDAAVVVEENTISYAGQAGNMPELDLSEYRVIDAADGTVMPGFIDCHAHLMGFDSGYMEKSDVELALKASKDCGDLVRSGFTAVRDMTRISTELKKAVDRGWFIGPRIMPAGQCLSQTSGHGDEAMYPYETAKDTPLSMLCDGREGCLIAVRKQFRRGAEFIKIMATGGVSSQADGLDDIQFSEEEVRVMVEEAARHGAYVAAHCTGTAGAKQALKCGVHTIEHGIMLDDECVELMKENGCTLVTTLYVSKNVANMKGLPDWLIEKGKKCWARNQESIAKAHAAGINIALGTDFGNMGPEANTDFSFIGKEFEVITEVGFTNMEAIQVGTINGARCMNKETKIGSLEAGKYADIVICAGRPDEDISVLGSADNIRFVMKDGQICKNTL